LASDPPRVTIRRVEEEVMNAKHLALALLLSGLSACSTQYPSQIRIRPPEPPQWAPMAQEPQQPQEQDTLSLAAAEPAETAEEAEPFEEGLASWYGIPFHGRQTASGEIFNRHEMTAAHPSLPLGTEIILTNLDTGRSVQLRVNDRFPGRPGYIIDVSQAAAKKLGFEREGRANVALELAENG
jgi:rare lipoprotein A